MFRFWEGKAFGENILTCECLFIYLFAKLLLQVLAAFVCYFLTCLEHNKVFATLVWGFFGCVFFHI